MLNDEKEILVGLTPTLLIKPQKQTFIITQVNFLSLNKLMENLGLETYITIKFVIISIFEIYIQWNLIGSN